MSKQCNHDDVRYVDPYNACCRCPTGECACLCLLDNYCFCSCLGEEE